MNYALLLIALIVLVLLNTVPVSDTFYFLAIVVMLALGLYLIKDKS